MKKIDLIKWFLSFFLLFTLSGPALSQEFHYTVSVPDAPSHSYHVTLEITGLSADTLLLKMPRWMPGYYQYMDYGDHVENLKALSNGLKTEKTGPNGWLLRGVKNGDSRIEYSVRTDRQFVATSYVDSTPTRGRFSGSFTDSHSDLLA